MYLRIFENTVAVDCSFVDLTVVDWLISKYVNLFSIPVKIL